MTSPMEIGSASSETTMNLEDKNANGYKRSKGVDASHGHKFEWETTLLTYLRCEKLYRDFKEIGNSVVNSFSIANNVQNIGVFDDIVIRMEYIDQGVKRTKLIFVQCKHVADTSKSETRYEKYMNDKSQIQKWFESYVRIQNILTSEYVDEKLLDKVKNKQLKLELHKKQREEIYALKKVFNCNIDDCEFIFISNMNPDKDQISQIFESRARTFPCSDYSSKLLKSTVGDGYEVRLKESALKLIDNMYSMPKINILKTEFCEKFRVFLNQTYDLEFFIIQEIISNKNCFRGASILRSELMEEITSHFNTSEYCELLTEKTELHKNVCCFSNLKCNSEEKIDEYRALSSQPNMFSREAVQELSKYLKPQEILEIRTRCQKLEQIKLIQFVLSENKEYLLLFLKNEEDVSNWKCARKTNMYRMISSIYIFSEPFVNISLYENEIFIQVIEQDIQNNYFDQFSEDTQKNVLQYSISFQGYTMSLSDICGKEWRHMLGEKTICDILSNKTISIGYSLPEYAPYVERKFKIAVFKEEKLNEVLRLVECYYSGQEFFLLTVYDGIQGSKNLSGPFEDLRSARFFINGMKLEDENSCHLFCYKNNDLQLLYSFGKKSEFTEKKVVKEDEVLHMGHKITMISDVAGMGKSTTSLSLARKYKDENPTHWVYLIALNKYQNILEKKSKNMNPSTVVEFIATYILGLNGFELHLFINACNKTGNVALFFDGVDEISGESFAFFESVLLAISLTNISRIVLSSRKNIANVLEKSLLCKSITLVPFTNEEREQFLVNIWGQKLKIEKQLNETVGENKVNETLLVPIANDVLTSLIYREESLGLPLPIKMIAEIYFDSVSISKFLKSGLYGNSLKLSLHDLYEDFIKLHIKRYLVKKVEWECDYSQETCSKIKAESICGNVSKVSSSIRVLEFTQENTNDIKNTIEFLIEFGILTSQEPAIFLHRTITEYLAAKYMINELFKNQCESESLDFVFKSVLVEDKYFVLRKFMNSLLTKTNLHINKHNVDDSSKLLNYKPDYLSLCIAATEGNTEILNFLLQYNETMLNTQTAMQETPQHRACSKGNIETVRYLLPRYISLENLLDNDGNTILHVASREGRKETIKIILNFCKSLLKIRNKKGESPLHVACKSCHTETVEMLISQYESINILVDNDGNTILHSAAVNGKSDLINLILKNYPLFRQVQNFLGMTPLRLAVIANNTEATKSLLDNYSQVKSNDFDTLLHCAIQNKNIEIVKLFLKHDISLLKAKNTGNQTPLHLAIIVNNEKAVKLFLNYKECSVNDVDNAGNTALHLASKKCGTRIIISVLLREHSLLNKQNNIGETPLHVACAEGNFDAAMLFLTHIDCKLEVCTHYGDSVLHASSVVANIEVMNLILERDPSLLNKQNSTGQTPLHLAIRENKVDAVKTLLSHTDCSVNAKDNRNETVLHYAASTGNVEVIRLLLLRGDTLINLRNVDGETPLEQAIRKENAEVSDYLCTFIYESSLIKDGRENNSAGKNAGVESKRLRHESYFSEHKKPKVTHSQSYGTNSYTKSSYVETSTSLTEFSFTHSNVSFTTSHASSSASFSNPLPVIPNEIISHLLQTDEFCATDSNISKRGELINVALDLQDELKQFQVEELSDTTPSNISSPTSLLAPSPNIPNSISQQFETDEFSDPATSNISGSKKKDYYDELHLSLKSRKRHGPDIQGKSKSK